MRFSVCFIDRYDIVCETTWVVSSELLSQIIDRFVEYCCHILNLESNDKEDYTHRYPVFSWRPGKINWREIEFKDCKDPTNDCDDCNLDCVVWNCSLSMQRVRE